MMRLAVAHLFTVASARAAGGPSAWTRCAGENGTCHCPGGAVRLGWARRDLWGPPVATRLASDGVNHGATTCAEARVPAPGGGSLARGRRSCQCTNAEPLRAVTSAWTARKNTVCTPPAAAVCDADVRRRAGRHLLDLNGAVRATAAAACGCDVVVFTTAFYEAGFFPVPLAHKIPPIYDGGFAAKAPCLVAVVNEATAAAFRREGHSPWRVVAVQGAAGRRAAKIPKLLPHVFFPAAGQTLFVDHKLTLQAHPLELIARLLPDEHAAVGAFAHPCAVDRPRPGLCAGLGTGGAPPGADARTRWLYDEGHAVLVGNRTADPAALKRQFARFRRDGVVIAHFVDAAIVAATRSPAAAALGCAWAREFLRDDASDRDQLAFAAISGAHEDAIRTATGASPPGCRPFCHWSFSMDDVAAKTGKSVRDRRFQRARREGLISAHY